MQTSIFAAVELAPRDPIMGLTEAYNLDTRPNKVNLGAGVYTNEAGKVPLLAAVREAEKQRIEAALPRGYLPIEGIAAYNRAVQEMLFGADSPLLSGARVATFGALGGTGALKVGADFLRRINPQAGLWISDPSWENHRALFEAAGFKVQTYPYYNAATKGVRFDEMIAALAALPAGEIVLLHACCHNPTGVDIQPEQWQQVVAALQKSGAVPFLDIAYQGFGDGIEPDAVAVRTFAASGMNFFVASSFSKSFSLYGERVGALSIVTSDKDETARVVSQVKRVIRTNYSTPPTHGEAIVATVLADARLRALWEEELAGMRDRIRAMRSGLVERLKANGVTSDLDYVVRQRGMFSYSGLSAAQVERLKTEFGVYAVSSGRICVASLNQGNLDTVAKAMAAVMAG
ncbi:MAG: aspartate/tyrosine/aromatic aminotransferase [Burkholderiaceae bacterium]|nr:aspartate/tyrosine/aromatic aminotransferase [Burkholderiaceae bacterium]